MSYKRPNFAIDFSITYQQTMYVYKSLGDQAQAYYIISESRR